MKVIKLGSREFIHGAGFLIPIDQLQFVMLDREGDHKTVFDFIGDSKITFGAESSEKFRGYIKTL